MAEYKLNYTGAITLRKHYSSQQELEQDRLKMRAAGGRDTERIFCAHISYLPARKSLEEKTEKVISQS